jgi:hypothetical protein
MLGTTYRANHNIAFWQEKPGRHLVRACTTDGVIDVESMFQKDYEEDAESEVWEGEDEGHKGDQDDSDSFDDETDVLPDF